MGMGSRLRGRRAGDLARVLPGMNSMARKSSPSSLSRSNTCAMFGWLKAAVMRASSRNIRTNSSSPRDVREDLLEHHELAEARQAALEREENLRHPARGQAAEHLVFAQLPAAEGVRGERQRRPTHVEKIKSTPPNAGDRKGGAGISARGFCPGRTVGVGALGGFRLGGSEGDIALHRPGAFPQVCLGLGGHLLAIPQAPQSPSVRLPEGSLRSEHGGDLPEVRVQYGESVGASPGFEHLIEQPDHRANVFDGVRVPGLDGEALPVRVGSQRVLLARGLLTPAAHGLFGGSCSNTTPESSGRAVQASVTRSSSCRRGKSASGSPMRKARWACSRTALRVKRSGSWARSGAASGSSLRSCAQALIDAREGKFLSVASLSGSAS